MKKKTSVLAVLALCALAAVPVGAQELPHGVWSGSLTPPPMPNGQAGSPIPATFEVGLIDGVLAVAMRSFVVQEIIRFNDIRLAGDELSFWFEPGVRVECTLRRTENGGFEGPCSDGNPTGAGSMTMIPPA